MVIRNNILTDFSPPPRNNLLRVSKNKNLIFCVSARPALRDKYTINTCICLSLSWHRRTLSTTVSISYQITWGTVCTVSITLYNGRVRRAQMLGKQGIKNAIHSLELRICEITNTSICQRKI